MNSTSRIANGLYIDGDGTRYWYRNGLLHRDHGPAVEWRNGSREWWRDGELHRDDGPAIERADGTREFWRRGLQQEQA